MPVHLLNRAGYCNHFIASRPQGSNSARAPCTLHKLHVNRVHRLHTHTSALHSLPPCPHSHTSHPLHFFLFTLPRVSPGHTSEHSLSVLHGRPLHLHTPGTCSPSSSCLALQSAPSAQGATRRARTWHPTAPTILLPRVLLSAERRYVTSARPAAYPYLTSVASRL